MKKVAVLLALSSILLLGLVNSVKADDGGPLSSFWYKDQKVHCVTVTNPEIVDGNDILLFDYSVGIGEKLGRPWTVVEAGKCYEIDKDGGVLYVIKDATSEDKSKYIDKVGVQSADNIVFQFNPSIDGNKKLVWSIDQYGAVTTTTEDEVYHSLNTNLLFPTDYELDLGVTSTSIGLELDMFDTSVYDDESFKMASEMYGKFAADLNDTLKKCDKRVRIETRLTIENNDNTDYPYSASWETFWKLSDGTTKNFEANKPEDTLPGIDFIGCSVNYSSFVLSNTSDFDSFDKLVEDLNSKYANNKDLGLFITKRASPTKAELIKFAKDNYVEDQPTEDTTSTYREVTAVTTTDSTPVETTLEEPTSEKKLNILFGSREPIMVLYILLPLIALIGLIIYMVLKNRKLKKQTLSSDDDKATKVTSKN